ncbi:MAG: SRPBCC family protein, partial [Dongiaceae bacterium]
RLEGRWRRTSLMICIYPSHVITLAPDHLWSLSLLPNGTGEVKVRFGLSYAPELLAEVNDWDAFVAERKATFDAINAEDRGTLEGLYPALASPLAKPGRLSYLERFTYDLNRYICRRLEV